MARVAPLLSSSSLFFMLTPIVLTMLVASWPIPAVEARFLQAPDEPKWIQEIHESPVDDKMPFEVRMRRSPQEEQMPDADSPPPKSPGFFSRVWTSIKNFASMAFRAVGNFFMGLFGCGSSHGADDEDTYAPRPHLGDLSPVLNLKISPGSEDTTRHFFDDNASTSSPIQEFLGAIATPPDHRGKGSAISIESPKLSMEPTDDSASSDNTDVSPSESSNYGKPAIDVTKVKVKDQGGESIPLPGDESVTVPESNENEIPESNESN